MDWMDLDRATENILVTSDIEIARKLETLSEQQRAFFQAIFNHPRDYILPSLRQAAHKLDVDPATLHRWIRGLGFHQYGEFRAYLYERGIAMATPVKDFENVPRRTDLVESAIDSDLKNLKRLRAFQASACIGNSLSLGEDPSSFH